MQLVHQGHQRMGKIAPYHQRKGQGYNETAHHIDKHDFSSATSIRHYIEKMDDILYANMTRIFLTVFQALY